ncbi:hypothetical protein XENOCAPTIV_022821, partial [Xenoophorus captivus]
LQRNDWDSVSGYSHAVQTMMLMVMKQASGRPWGDHGLFLRYHIEAATVKGINSFRQYKTDVTTIGRLLSGEGTEQGWRVLKLVAVLYLAVLLGCTALINFSLGFILALTLVPVAAFVTPHVPKYFNNRFFDQHFTRAEIKLNFDPFFPPQNFVSRHLGGPQPSLHAPLLCVFLPRAAGNACQLPRRLAVVPVGYFAGNAGPLLVRFSGLPTHCLDGLSMLAAFLEHPFLEVACRSA